MRYLLKLAGRMARAAIAVPARDLDNTLALSAAARYMEAFCLLDMGVQVGHHRPSTYHQEGTP